MGVLVTKTRGAAGVLALLQHVTQLRAVQRAPTHAPIKVINGLALDKTHTLGDKGRGDDSGEFCCYEESIFMTRLDSLCPLA